MVTNDNSSISRKSDSAKATIIKALILDDSWWDHVEYLLKFIAPILSMVQYTEIDSPFLGEVYDGIDFMIVDIRNIINEKEKDLDENFFKESQVIMVERWKKMTAPFH